MSYEQRNQHYTPYRMQSPSARSSELSNWRFDGCTTTIPGAHTRPFNLRLADLLYMNFSTTIHVACHTTLSLHFITHLSFFPFIETTLLKGPTSVHSNAHGHLGFGIPYLQLATCYKGLDR